MAADPKPESEGKDKKPPPATREELYDRLKELLVEQLGVKEADIGEDSAFQADLDADSLDLVELIMELEDGFGEKISDDDSKKLVTVSDALNYLCGKLGIEQ